MSAARSGAARVERSAAAPRTGRSSRSRPRLQLVERVRWWRRVPWVAVVFVVVFVGCLFGALWTHVSLISGQQRLDAIQTEISRERLRREELRREQSQLQGPEEVRRIAVEEYGMVDAAPAEAVAATRPTIRAQALPASTDTAPED